MQNSMMLIKSTWNNKQTFRLIPIHKDCPYNEAIYDLDQHVLALIGRDKKQIYQMVPKFNEKGDVQYLKTPRENGKTYAEERRLIENYYEYYIEDKEEILVFIELFVSPSARVIAEKYMSAEPAINDPVIFEGAKSL